MVAAEELSTLKIFTLDKRDFEAYRVKRGHRKIGVRLAMGLGLTRFPARLLYETPPTHAAMY